MACLSSNLSEFIKIGKKTMRRDREGERERKCITNWEYVYLGDSKSVVRGPTPVCGATDLTARGSSHQSAKQSLKKDHIIKIIKSNILFILN